MRRTTGLPRDDGRALALILRHGRTAVAFQALGRGLAHWFDEETDAFVAYADTGHAWVAAGEPIAAIHDATRVAERFVRAASGAGRRCCFFATEGVLAASPRLRRTRIGEQPVWNPGAWAAGLRGHRSMREQLRRARAKGVTVREVPCEALGDPRLAASLHAVVARWLASRTMPPMRFLVDVAPFDHPAQRRVLVAERQGEIVALLSMAPVPARGGWLFEHLLRDPVAPNGSAELLIDAAMRDLAERGVGWVSLGLAPLAGPVSGWLRAARSLSRPLFNFAGLWAFKRKLRPDAWAPIYLAYPRERYGAAAMYDGLRAFAGSSLTRFGVRTALRGPRPLLRLLELALVPWTVALALVPTAPWFPSRGVHVVWIAFDVGLLLALRALRRHGDVRLARVVASAVTVDAVLTLAQAALWSVPAAAARGALSPLTMFAVVVACAGPAIAAPVLWGASRRLAALRGARHAPTAPAS